MGQPEKQEPLKSIDLVDSVNRPGTELAKNDASETRLVPRPKDGLVREIIDNVKVSREERNERVETEDIHHLGDFSDKVREIFITFFFFCMKFLNLWQFVI